MVPKANPVRGENEMEDGAGISAFILGMLPDLATELSNLQIKQKRD